MLDNEISYFNNRQISPYTVIKNLITEFNFVNLGTIKKVHNEHYVDVQTYYKNGDGTNNIIQDVRLLQLGTTKCKVFIQPAIGDNVLVLTPKDFVSVLSYNEKPKDLETSYMPYGNVNACGILIREESDDNVKTTLNIDSDGNIEVATDGDANVSANNIVLNGGENNSHLVRYEELEKGLSSLWDAIKTHKHPYIDDGASATTSPSAELAQEDLDISKSKIDTILTEESSS